MKHDWEYKLLGEVSEIVGGSTPKTSIDSYWGGEYPWVTPAELNGAKYIDKTERTITDEALAHTNLQLLPVGTVLLSSRAPIGKLAITQIPMYCNQGFKNIIPGDSLYNEFAYWYLTYKKDYIISLGRGATFKEISKSITEKIPIPIPSLDEQKQICSLLDKMNRVIEAKKEQLKELDNLAQAIFYDMFGDPTVNDKGWEKQKLGDCFSYIKNGANIKQDKSQIGFPITRIETLSNGVFNRDRMGYAGITDKTKYEQYILQDKDLLMSHINSKAYIGRTVLYRKKEGEVFIHGMNLLRLVPLPLLDSEFFCYLAKTDYVKEKIASIRKDAVNQSSFAISDLKKIDIPIPPLPLQQAFAEKMKAIEQQKELINQSIKDVQTLFDAKMDYYFGD